MMIKNDYKYTKKKTKIGGKGFYIALGCCLLAVGLGGYKFHGDTWARFRESRPP